jgi:hypothetical protein
MSELARIPMPTSGVNIGPQKLVIKELHNGESYYIETFAQAPSDARLGTQDGFSRTRIADPTVLFDSTMEYTPHDHLWDTYASGMVSSGLSEYNYLQMNVSGIGRMTRQTWQYQRYQPGKSQLILMTGVLGSKADGVSKRIGYFDNANGLFFELDGTALYVVKRGSGIDTRVAQNDWNVKKANGDHGEFILDPALAQIYFIDFEWLGVGQVRFGIYHEGKPCVLHIMEHANVVDRPYMATANLPARYEIISTSSQGVSWMRQICTSIISEGGAQRAGGGQCSVYTPTTGVSCTQDTWNNVLAVRPRPTMIGPGGIPIINRSLSIPESASIAVASGPTISYVRILYAECLTNHGTWTMPSVYQLLQGSTDVTVFFALQPVYSVVIQSTGGSGSKQDAGISGSQSLLLPFSYSYDGTRVRVYIIQVYPVGGGCTAHATVSQYGVF